MYIEKMAPEESLYVGFSGARVTLHVHWDECCRKVVMMPAKTHPKISSIYCILYREVDDHGADHSPTSYSESGSANALLRDQHIVDRDRLDRVLI